MSQEMCSFAVSNKKRGLDDSDKQTEQSTFSNKQTTMKRILTTLAVMVMILTSAAAMSFNKARKEASFLTDKMAYELSLSTSQMDAVYEINLDYLLSLNTPADLDGIYWMRRNSDLRYVLSAWQWDLYTQIVDFYRPMYWASGNHFLLYLRNRYTHSSHFYFDRPTVYGSYRGGHNREHHSYYANRNYGAPSVPSYTHINGTGRMGSNGDRGGNHSGNRGGNGNQPQNGHFDNRSNHGAPSVATQPQTNANQGRATVTNEGRTTTPATSSGSTRGRSAGGGSTVSGNTNRSSRSGSTRGGR